MKIEERITKKRAELEKLKSRIENDKKKIAKIQDKITELEMFQIKSMSKNMNISVSDMCSLLSELIDEKSNKD